MAWFKKGEEAIRALEQRERLYKMLREKSVPRFWLREGEEARIIFVDDTGFFCEQHYIKRGNSFTKLTCPNDQYPCPVCIRDNKRPIGITFFTIIDLRQYIRKDGTLAKNEKKLLPAKGTLARQIWDYKKEYGTLVGAIATLKRFSQREASCGTIKGFELAGSKKLKRVRIPPEYTPFDYVKILAPPTQEEWELLGYKISIVGDEAELSELDDTPVPIGDELELEDNIEEDAETEEVLKELDNIEEDQDEGVELDVDIENGDVEDVPLVVEESKPKKKSRK